MNTIQKNKLLAEFLGYEIEETLKGEKVYAIRLPDATGTKTDFYTPKELKFHCDWNWLMLVVDKIESIELKDGTTFTIDFYCSSVTIFAYGNMDDELIFTEGKGRLINLYNACIEFVQWFNECGSEVKIIN